MKKIHELKEALCKELDDTKTAKMGELASGELDAIYKLTSSIKNLDKMIMLEEGGYSGDGNWEAGLRGTYGRGSSYDGGGSSYDGSGNYSSRRGGGRGRNRDSMGRYTRDGSESIMKHLNAAMQEADNPQMREAIEKVMDYVDRM